MRQKYLVLLQRELWEHRLLWIAPLAVGGLLTLAMIFLPNGEGKGFSFHVRPAPAGLLGADAGATGLIGTGVFLGAVAALVVLTYLLDCLYAERKDRSILFWKSLPVSDTQAVLAKLVVALVIVPAGVILLALLLQPLLAAIVYMRFDAIRPDLTWKAAVGWPEGLGRLALTWIYCLLWYLPVAAYLMLASVVARRLPLVHAALPVVVLWMWEWMFVEGNAIRSFLQERLFPWGKSAAVLLNARVENRWLDPFHDSALWMGVAVGAGMLYMVIRVRRYRDDS